MKIIIADPSIPENSFATNLLLDRLTKVVMNYPRIHVSPRRAKFVKSFEQTLVFCFCRVPLAFLPATFLFGHFECPCSQRNCLQRRSLPIFLRHQFLDLPKFQFLLSRSRVAISITHRTLLIIHFGLRIHLPRFLEVPLLDSLHRFLTRPIMAPARLEMFGKCRRPHNHKNENDLNCKIQKTVPKGKCRIRKSATLEKCKIRKKIRFGKKCKSPKLGNQGKHEKKKKTKSPKTWKSKK